MMPDPSPKETLPAQRPPPSREAMSAPTGHYPVAPVPDADVGGGRGGGGGDDGHDPYAGIGQTVISTELRALVTAELPAELFDVLPTGEVYLPQVQYRKILTRVFGPGGWGLRPLGEWVKQGNVIAREYGLYANGRFIAAAFGEQEWVPTNPRMSWATAAEAAKSNALMRTCKDLGIAAQAWDKTWAQWFQGEHCVRVWVQKDGRNPASGVEARWRRKDAGPFMFAGQVIERGPVSAPKTAYRRPEPEREPGVDDGPEKPTPSNEATDLERALEASFEPDPEDPAREMRERETLAARPSLSGFITDKQVQQIWIEARRNQKSEAVVHEYLLQRYGLRSVKQIPKVAFDAIVQWLQRPADPGPQPTGRVVCRRPASRRR